MHFQYATLPMWYITRNQDHRLIVKQPPPVLCGRTLPVYQEQQLFMGRPAPSPPRSATGREDGAHCGAGPPCTFRYARIDHAYVTKKTRPRSVACKNCRLVNVDHSVDPYPPRGSNHAPWDWGRVHNQLYRAQPTIPCVLCNTVTRRSPITLRGFNKEKEKGVASYTIRCTKSRGCGRRLSGRTSFVLEGGAVSLAPRPKKCTKDSPNIY